jgi:hypothetical protein
MSIKSALGYMIIDFATPIFKYRINSLNIYYNGKYNKLRYIWGKRDDALDNNNILLKQRFKNFLSAGWKKNTLEMVDDKGNDSCASDDDESSPIVSTKPLCNESLSECKQSQDTIKMHMLANV